MVFKDELLLVQVCEKIGLPKTMHDRAIGHYEAVGKWLAADDGVLGSGNMRVYPQGSVATGTTNHPLRSNEFDFDAVCEADLDIGPLEMLNAVESRLRANDIYAPRIERKNRCIRLIYKNDFHIDMLPAKPNFDLPVGCVLVPDRELRAWKHSAPKGYAHWFRGRCRIFTVKNALAERMVEPAPDHEEFEDKYVLQHVVQLLKRARDVAFEEREEFAPVSIVLTTLAGVHYGGERTISEAMANILLKIQWQITAASEPIKVFNPANPNELLSERWLKVSGAYEQFKLWAMELVVDWEEYQSAVGIHAKGRILERLFGEAARTVLNEHIDSISASRSSQTLRVASSGRLMMEPMRGLDSMSVRKNTFFGDK